MRKPRGHNWSWTEMYPLYAARLHAYVTGAERQYDVPFQNPAPPTRERQRVHTAPLCAATLAEFRNNHRPKEPHHERR